MVWARLELKLKLKLSFFKDIQNPFFFFLNGRIGKGEGCNCCHVVELAQWGMLPTSLPRLVTTLESIILGSWFFSTFKNICLFFLKCGSNVKSPLGRHRDVHNGHWRRIKNCKNPPCSNAHFIKFPPILKLKKKMSRQKQFF